MNLFKRIYWWFRGWKASLSIGTEVMRDGLKHNWDADQASEMYAHRMKQWAKAHLPQELQ